VSFGTRRSNRRGGENKNSRPQLVMLLVRRAGGHVRIIHTHTHTHTHTCSTRARETNEFHLFVVIIIFQILITVSVSTAQYNRSDITRNDITFAGNRVAIVLRV